MMANKQSAIADTAKLIQLNDNLFWNLKDLDMRFGLDSSSRLELIDVENILKRILKELLE